MEYPLKPKPEVYHKNKHNFSTKFLTVTVKL